MNTLIPIDPPGTILMEEFIEPAGLTQKAVAQATGIHPVRLNELIQGKRRISAEIAIRLGTYFQTSSELWIRLQSDYDLRTTERAKGPEIRASVKPFAA